MLMIMITEFKRQWSGLSNFAFTYIIFEGETYRSVEHAFQAAKTLDKEERRKIRLCQRPSEAKKLGKLVKIRSDWEEVKIQIMKELVKQKFYKEPYKSLLLSTEDEKLVEGNWWGDKFWGQCPIGNGQNWLGKLLMEIRQELK